MKRCFCFFASVAVNGGARPEVVSRATSAVAQCIETLTDMELARGNIKVDASFEEFNLNVDIEYEGVLPLLSDTPSDRGGTAE